jgi:hypothetical protein
LGTRKSKALLYQTRAIIFHPHIYLTGTILATRKVAKTHAYNLFDARR